jgi:ribosomal protein L11 methyltransferase
MEKDSAFDEYILALLSNEDFYAFETVDNALEAYSLSQATVERGKELLVEILKPRCSLEISFIPEQNWNKVWESSYEPVRLCDGSLFIRAPHHSAAPKHSLEIIIKPGMGFGTGHHPTTVLIAEALMQESLEGKSVLDVGCGSGILAFLAVKRGARLVIAVDNDPAALENARENQILNGLSSETIIWLNDLREASGTFDVIVANINRNTLQALSEEITDLSQPHSRLFLSGFFKEDEGFLIQHFGQKGWQRKFSRNKEGWSMLALENLSD